ncbi:MAG: methyl-accepting chemotaxis protein [Burkholderiaceae bacterium]
MFSTIRSQLFALLSFALLVVLLLGGVGLYNQSQFLQALEQAQGDGIAMRNHMQTDMLHYNLRGLVEQYNGAVRDNSPDRVKATVAEIKTNAANIQQEFAKNNNAATLSEKARTEIVRIAPLITDYAGSAEKVSSITEAVELEAARALFNGKFKVLEGELGAVRDLIEGEIIDTKNTADVVANRSLLLTVATLIIGALLLAILGFMLYAKLALGLGKVQETIEKVNKGETAARTLMTGKDELGTLGRAFDGMLDDRISSLEKSSKENETMNNSVIDLLQTVFQLSNRDLTARAPVTEDIIGTVSSSINQLSEETGRTLAEVQDIAEQVRTTSESVRVQSVMVEETARSEREALQSMSTSLTQATDQMSKVAALSDQSNIAAEQAATATQAALTAVDGTVKGMDQLRDSISDMEKRFKRLGERSQEISTAVQLINTISERTHVLALNASMQAATAGEAGRGFAVVAEEVQRLSDSSRQATAQISQLVGNIQGETNETLFTVNRLIGEVVKQSELAQRAGVQMNQTQSTTQQLVSLVRQIATFSDQQAKLAASLQQSVKDINQGTEQTSSAIAEQTASTQTLADFSRRLTQAVGQFKLPEQTA